MAQSDMNIANQGFPAFRADLNDQLEALVTNSSGATAPATTFPHQWWLDTSTTPSTLRQRNAANDAWVVIGLVDQSANAFTPANAVLLSGDQSAAGTKNFTGNIQLVGSQVYARSNILGTVSQSGGVPTGAIIERGSNANGDFVKYADGTLICYTPNRLTVDSSTAARGGTWTFPSPFLSATSYTAQFYILESSTGTATINTDVTSVNQTNLSASVAFVVSINNGTSGFTAFAIGRWY
jgi:hypothetical protein